jgi:hypothetical protein
MIMAILVLIVAVVWIAFGIVVPNGAWGRNVVAGTLAMLTPSVAARRERRWIMLATMAAALIATGSRGGLLAAIVALAILFWSKQIPRWAAIAMPAGIVALVFAMIQIRPATALGRFECWAIAVRQWMQLSPAYGVGPGNLMLLVPSFGTRGFEVHAHNSIVTIAAMVGMVGAGLIAAALANIKRVQMNRWQIATLAALAVHSLVDDPLTWLSTLLIAAVVAAGCGRENSLGTTAL